MRKIAKLSPYEKIGNAIDGYYETTDIKEIVDKINEIIDTLNKEG